MKNKDLLTGLIELIEENNNLKNRIKELKGYYNKEEEINIEDKFKELKETKNYIEAESQYYYIKGKIIYSWNIPKLEIEEDGEKMNFLTYEQWIKLIYIDNLTPEAKEIMFKISFKEFVNILDKGFRRYYEILLKEAKNKALKDVNCLNN